MKRKTIIFIFVLIVSLVYFSGVEFYKKRFLPRTYINDQKASGLTIKELHKELSKDNNWKEIDVVIDDEVLFTIKDEDINYEYYGSNNLLDIANEKSWLWFTEFAKKKNHEMEIVFIFNNMKIKSIVDNHENLKGVLNNASLVYSKETQQFEITPHSYALSINVDNIVDEISREIKKKSEVLVLDEYVIYPEILSNNERLLNLQAEANVLLDTVLTYDFGGRKEIIDKKLIKDWMSVENLELIFNKDLMRDYIITLSNKYDTYGKSRDFKTTDGEVIKTSGGTYGWLIHRANTVDKLIKDIKAGESKTVEPVYSYKAVNRGKDDIGDSYVEIDIANQMVYVYSKGELKVSTPTVTGNVSKGHDTPISIDPLNYKTTNAVLRGPGYASPVKYWMPFNGGVGLHDANWRTEFGGDIYKTNGSHGCINLPPEVAKEVYDLVFPGMPVIVY